VTIDDARGAYRRAAVGHTRESAAAAFGRGADDLFVTSYADLDAEVDLGGLQELDLVLDENWSPALEVACARLVAGELSVRIAVRPGASGRLADLLSRAGVMVTALEDGGETVLLSLAPNTPEHPGDPGIVLTALDAGAGARRDDSPPDPAVRPPAAVVRKRRPSPRLLRVLAAADRWLASRRRRVVLVGITVVVVVAMLLIGLVPDSAQLLTSIGLPVLLVLVVASAAVTVYTTLLLARQVHRQTGRVERLLLRNREVVHERANALAKRLDAVEEAQSRLPFLEQYVEAVAEGSAASNTLLRDLLETLDLDQTVERSRPTQ
jgi:hypothetical protein